MELFSFIKTRGPVSAAAALTAVLALLACARQPQPEERPFVIGLHGGAGVIERKDMTPQLERDYREALDRALDEGFRVLEAGGGSVEAVEAAIRVMEDSPLFNAGKGASFTSAGTNELDASIMNGRTMRAGAVGAVQFVRNPIRLARLVMENSPHVLLVGEGALAFAREQGAEIVPADYFYTDRRWESLQQSIEQGVPFGKQTGGPPNAAAASKKKGPEEDRFDTVGAVALDKAGNLAAGTSTGGRVNKRPGRVGDSPIIGAGCYAENGTCAASTTGLGEKHMVICSTKEISALMAHKKMSIQQAVDDVILRQLAAVGGEGGAVALDKSGVFASAFTGSGMYRGFRKSTGERDLKIYREE